MLTLPVHDAKNGGPLSNAVGSLVKNEPHRHYQNGHLSHSDSEDDDDEDEDNDIDVDDEDDDDENDEDTKFKLASQSQSNNEEDDEDDDETLDSSSVQDKTKKTKKKNSRGRRLISSDEMATTVLLPPLEMSLDEQRVLGYMPLRDDFEREYKNDAETLLSNLSISNQQIVFLNKLF
jgi:hypothetical protein